MRHVGHESVRRARRSSDGGGGARWQGPFLVASGWAGVGLAYAAVGSSRDPTSGAAVLWTAGVAVASLAAIGRGAAVAITDALSPLRYVFRSRPASSTAAMLFAPAAVALALLIHRAPFDGIAAHGKPLAELITDLACIAASLICLIGGIVALRGMWNARGDERSWKRSLQN